MKMILGVVLSVVLFVIWCLQRPDGNSNSDSTIELQTAFQTTISTLINATGVIKPKTGAEIKVGSRVSGVVKTLYVDIGNSVETGQLLAQLVGTEIRSEVVAMEMLPEDKNLTTIQNNINKFEEIISTILESERINLHDMAVNSTECNLDELIRDCIALNKNSKPDIKFFNLGQGLSLHADQGLIKLLLHNIIENALLSYMGVALKQRVRVREG